MKSKKEQVLLKDILSVLLKYDFATIETCIDYLVENKQQLRGFLAFANGGKAEIQSNKSDSMLNNILFTTEEEKRVIIKRIYKYLSGKRFTYSQIYQMSVQYFKERPISISLDADNKNELLLALTRGLVNLPVEEVHGFEYYIQVQKKPESENTLENWSKVIVKEQV